ncbi:hypothetical protein Fot_44202 [Forsythia ovata]|uniref:Uncharacterized protein n=1 Tax=Forsythia ovata TaxID=205694 RepID=A0ABD1R2X3_9LAMI
MGFLYKKQKFSLLEGLVRIRSNVDIDMLLKDRNGANEVEIYLVPPSRTYELEWDSSIPIPNRPPSPEMSNVRKGLVIIDPETGEELPRLDPSKLQTKEKNEKRKSKQDEDDMSSRSKRRRSKTSVKLVEIVELSGSESDVPDDNVGSDVPNNPAGIEGDIVEGVGREELETEICPGGDDAGNGNDRDKSGYDVVDNVGDKSDNARVDNIEDESDNVGDKSDNLEGTYVPEFEANADCNIEVDWDEFLENHQEDIWNSWEDGFGMNNEENNQHGVESEEHEVQTEELQEGFVDSDFEFEEEPIPTQDHPPSAANVDLGMDDMAGHQGNVDDDTDYGESDDLQSLGSNDELGNNVPRKRQYTFNQHTEMENPSFQIGMQNFKFLGRHSPFLS